MTRIAVRDIEIDRCPRCGGLWLDALELDKLRADKDAARRADRASPGTAPGQKARVPGLCPRDRSPLIAMADREQPHVHFESCTVCGGVFLEAGELRDLSELTILERLGFR